MRYTTTTKQLSSRREKDKKSDITGR